MVNNVNIFTTYESLLQNLMKILPKIYLNKTTRFFYKQHFYKQLQAEIDKKVQQMLSNTQRLNFCYSNFIDTLHPRYHPKIIGYILKIKQKKKCVCIHEILGLITMKIRMNMKNRSHRYDINRPRSRHGHKYSKYKKCFSMIILIGIKQHQSNI